MTKENFPLKRGIFDQWVKNMKSAESRPPKNGHFKGGGLLSSFLAKNPSKWLKMHFFGHKGDKIFIIQPHRGIL